MMIMVIFHNFCVISFMFSNFCGASTISRPATGGNTTVARSSEVKRSTTNTGFDKSSIKHKRKIPKAFWMVTVVDANSTENITGNSFKTKLEARLTSLFSEGFARSSGKQQEVGKTNVHIFLVFPSNAVKYERTISLVYFVKHLGELVIAKECLELLEKYFTKEEIEKILLRTVTRIGQYRAVSKVKRTKPLKGQIIGAVFGCVILLAFVVWFSVCAYFKFLRCNNSVGSYSPEYSAPFTPIEESTGNRFRTSDRVPQEIDLILSSREKPETRLNNEVRKKCTHTDQETQTRETKAIPPEKLRWKSKEREESFDSDSPSSACQKLEYVPDNNVERNTKHRNRENSRCTPFVSRHDVYRPVVPSEYSIPWIPSNVVQSHRVVPTNMYPYPPLQPNTDPFQLRTCHNIPYQPYYGNQPGMVGLNLRNPFINYGLPPQRTWKRPSSRFRKVKVKTDPRSNKSNQ